MATKVNKLSEMELLSKVEKAYNAMPENTNTTDILQMLANATGKSLTTMNERYNTIKNT